MNTRVKTLIKSLSLTGLRMRPLGVLPIVIYVAIMASAQPRDALPSWQDGAAKKTIVDS